MWNSLSLLAGFFVWINTTVMFVTSLQPLPCTNQTFFLNQTHEREDEFLCYVDLYDFLSECPKRKVSPQMAVMSWHWKVGMLQHRGLVFRVLDRTKIHFYCTTYLHCVYRGEKVNSKPTTTWLFGGTLHVFVFGAWVPRHVCWHRKQAAQAQNDRIEMLDMMEIKQDHYSYLLLVLFLKKANSRHAMLVCIPCGSGKIPAGLDSIPNGKLSSMATKQTLLSQSCGIWGH